MLARRIIPCLDIRDGKVVKGVRFRDHAVVGDIVPLAQRYSAEGADELVLYDIAASSDQRCVDRSWITCVAAVLDIPFCVAGGIRTVEQARAVLENGADKISINSPALERPDLIDDLAQEFGSQCVVVGIDSRREDGDCRVHQYTGDVRKACSTGRATVDWAEEAVARGAGEIVLNCMNEDGMRQGYDIPQLRAVRDRISVPLIASGGAGALAHFVDVFRSADVDGALAAGIFHSRATTIEDLKRGLKQQDVAVRL